MSLDKAVLWDMYVLIWFGLRTRREKNEQNRATQGSQSLNESLEHTVGLQ